MGHKKSTVWFACCILLSAPTIIDSCPFSDRCESNNPNELMCNDTVSHEDNRIDWNVTSLKLCNFYNFHANVDEYFVKFPNLRHLTIFNSDIDFNITFQQDNDIEVLRITSSNVRNLDSLRADRFGKLSVLDLSYNNIRRLSETFLNKIRHLQLDTFYLAGNEWNCSLNLSWSYHVGSLITDSDHLLCYDKPYQGIQLLPVANFLKNMHENCPQLCQCSMPNVVVEPATNALDPMIEVDCSNRSLTEFPYDLPKHTKSILLNNNRIKDLRTLSRNQHYRNILEVYLNHNEIESIDCLEGSYFLSRFRILSLIGNQISQMPAYAFDNALQQNQNMPHAVRLYFSRNPWKCDCSFTPSFQEFLIKYQSQVHDSHKVRCASEKGDKNSHVAILSLTRSAICSEANENSVQIIDLVNVVLASLIVLILGKLAYDYYYFKRTGRLPWIATKIP